MQVLHQFVGGGEPERIIAANFDAELPFHGAQQLNMPQRVPRGSGDHVRSMIEFRNMEHLFG